MSKHQLLAGLNAGGLEAVFASFRKKGHGLGAVAITAGSNAVEQAKLIASEAMLEGAGSAIKVARIAIISNDAFSTSKQPAQVRAARPVIQATRLLKQNL